LLFLSNVRLRQGQTDPQLPTVIHGRPRKDVSMRGSTPVDAKARAHAQALAFSQNFSLIIWTIQKTKRHCVKCSTVIQTELQRHFHSFNLRSEIHGFNQSHAAPSLSPVAKWLAVFFDCFQEIFEHCLMSTNIAHYRR